MRSAIVFGSSGLIGSHLVRELLADARCERVTVVVRREPEFSHAKLRVVKADLESIDRVAGEMAGDDVYLALGTTRARTPDRAEYYRIDHDYPVRAAELAHKSGATRAAVVTAVGANAHSRSFYLRTKGEIERDLVAVGFERLHIFRPSMLLGDRTEHRPMERVLMTAFRAIGPALAGPMNRFRGIEASDVARAMVTAMAEDNGEAVNVYHWREMIKLRDAAGK